MIVSLNIGAGRDETAGEDGSKGDIGFCEVKSGCLRRASFC